MTFTFLKKIKTVNFFYTNFKIINRFFNENRKFKLFVSKCFDRISCSGTQAQATHR